MSGPFSTLLAHIYDKAALMYGGTHEYIEDGDMRDGLCRADPQLTLVHERWTHLRNLL